MKLRVGKTGQIVSDEPFPNGCVGYDSDDNIDFYGGYLVAESVSPENAKDIVFSYNLKVIIEECMTGCSLAGLPTEKWPQQIGLAVMRSFIDLYREVYK